MIYESLVQVAFLGEIDDNLEVTGLLNNDCMTDLSVTTWVIINDPGSL